MTQTNEKQKLSTWFFNPFLFLGGERMLFLGLIVLAIHIPAGYFLNIRFDGAVDMHLVSSVASWTTPVFDVLIAWGSMVLCMFGSAKLYQAPIRLRDIAGAVAFSRIPLLISILPAILLGPDVQSVEQMLSLEGSDLYQLFALAVISIFFLLWFFVLLFNAFKINSNLKGGRLWWGYIGAILTAEAVSIVVLRMI